jgi:hypothetical protein
MRVRGIIPRMCRRLVAALLIIGWVSLSGFDVVEDLDEIPGQAGFSQSSGEEGFSSKRAMGPLANNIIESANRTQQTTADIVTFFPTIFHFDSAPIFSRHFQLHKLYRVFLI